MSDLISTRAPSSSMACPASGTLSSSMPCPRATTTCCNCSAAVIESPHALVLHMFSPVHTTRSADVSLACASSELADRGLWSNLGDAPAALSGACAAECAARHSRPVRILTVRHPYTYYASMYEHTRSGRRSAEAAILSRIFNTTRRDRVPPLRSLGAFVAWILTHPPVARWSRVRQRWERFSPATWSLSARLAARCGAEQCATGADERVRHELVGDDTVELVGRLWPTHAAGVREALGPPAAAPPRCPFEDASRAGASLRAWRLMPTGGGGGSGGGGALGDDLRAAVARHDSWAFQRFGYPMLTPGANDAAWLSGLGCAGI